ncbi:transporter [Sphingobium sp. AP49]|uniref:transporter n=1 Tax=Sphingobium sp. AP49 TaxID=1144307 RepID=UPI00026EC90D|nr:transporter [Sphingobium sp. AP49]WHO38226.1 transporter [Sphingobium sp. AP49]
MRTWGVAILVGIAAHGGAAFAQETREFCADRPGLDTPPCTMAPGKVQVELGLGDWTREQDAESRTDTVNFGDALLRIGLTDSMEAQLGWTAFGHVRTRDRVTGAVETDSGIGDMRVALRQNLRNPDGSGFSIAVMPYASLPTGGDAIGDGDWGAGLLVPISYDLGHGLTLQATPEVDAAVDEDGDGRHLAYGSVAGLGFEISDELSGSIEASLMRDEDPDGHAMQALAGLSLGWQSGDDMQFDLGANLGLNHDSPDAELYVGVVRRF